MTGAAPAMSKAQAWKLAVRLPTLPAAVAPVLVGSGVAIAIDEFRWLPALVCMLCALLLQVGANFANDVFDYRKGADTAGRLGPPRATQLGLLGEREVLTGMWVTFALATLGGIYLVYEGGWPILAVGLASIVAAIIYTGGPWPIGYHALGDVFTFVFFGLAAVVGTVYVQAESAPALAWLAAIPMGCTVTAILVVNNLRDREQDARSKKTTLAVVMGDRLTRSWYALLVAAAYGAAAFSSVEANAWVLLAFASLPFAMPPLRAVLGGTSGRALNPILKSTARFHLALGVSYAVGLSLSG